MVARDFIPQTAMVLAAGLGQRMRARPDDPPKPLIRVGDETLLDRILTRLEAVGVTRIIVNVHHKAEAIEAHLRKRESKATLVVSDERAALLETGGGVAKALPLLGDAPFFVCNADGFWLETRSNLRGLAMRFASYDNAPACLMLAPFATATGYDGVGDFAMDAHGQLTRATGKDAFVFSGVQILPPDLMAGYDAVPFSLNRVYDDAAAQGRLVGYALDGQWLHVGTPEGHSAAEAILENRG